MNTQARDIVGPFRTEATVPSALDFRPELDTASQPLQTTNLALTGLRRRTPGSDEVQDVPVLANQGELVLGHPKPYPGLQPSPWSFVEHLEHHILRWSDPGTSTASNEATNLNRFPCQVTRKLEAFPRNKTAQSRIYKDTLESKTTVNSIGKNLNELPKKPKPGEDPNRQVSQYLPTDWRRRSCT
jgi:hypothetical protein